MKLNGIWFHLVEWGLLAVLEFSVAGPEVSAQHQREARQVQDLDHDWSLGNKRVKMIAWGFSEVCAGGLPVQSKSLKIAQMIYHYTVRTIGKIHQTEFVSLLPFFLHFLTHTRSKHNRHREQVGAAFDHLPFHSGSHHIPRKLQSSPHGAS